MNDTRTIQVNRSFGTATRPITKHEFVETWRNHAFEIRWALGLDVVEAVEAAASVKFEELYEKENTE